jgi:hypothetical protein
MPDERRQFGVLYRAFISRLIDLELLSSGGQVQNLLAQFAAMLAALSFVITVVRIPAIGGSTLPPEKLALALWGDEHFLIATTMAIVGMFAVLAWNNLFPDRVDTLVLGTLPVRIRTMLLAKLAAIAMVLGVSAAAVNSFTGLAYPFVMVAPGAGTFGVLRSLLAYWAVMAMAALFVFTASLAVQGLAAQLLSYRLLVRVSSYLQLGAFFTILGAYFLMPPVSARPVWLPSYWFLALFHEFNGSQHETLRPLAWRAALALAGSIVVAAVTYGLVFNRNTRRIVEQPDIAPGDRSRPASRIGGWAAARLLSKPLDRAILLFTARTMARSRQHRMLLAVYGGIGLAIALAYARDLVYGRSRWHQPNVSLLIGSFVLLFFFLIGSRAVIALPFALRANWIFRITAVYSPTAYFAAVRKAMTVLAAGPVWIIAAVLYSSLWPSRAALPHLLVLVLSGVLLIQLLLHRFRKIPFACSYLPGKTDLRIKLGSRAILFMAFSNAAVHLEFWAMQRAGRFAVVAGLLFAATAWAWRRTVDFAQSRYQPLQFEDLPPDAVQVLNLQNDGVLSGDERYVDART